MLAKGCIILMLHQIVISSTIFKLIISRSVASASTWLNEWNLSILGKLILEHKIAVVTILAIEIILIGKVPKAILLILALHLVNLSFQIRNFLIAIILPILSMRDLSVLS